MLLVAKPEPNRLDVELSAVLDGDMMAAGLDQMLEQSKDVTNGVMMFKIPTFAIPTGGAMMAEMMRLPQLFQMIRHFDRCAVLSDIGWIRTAAELEGAMIPGLAIKGFNLSQDAAAEAWLARNQNGNQPDKDDDDFNGPV